MNSEESVEQPSSEPIIKEVEMKMNASGTEVKMSVAKEVALGIAASFAELLQEAPNYIEMEIKDETNHCSYLMSIQRLNRPTAHQLRKAAEEQLDKIVKTLKLEDKGNHWLAPDGTIIFKE